MPLPGRYRKKGEKAISSFDFIDIARNRALETFFLTQFDDGQTMKFGLTNTRFPSTTTNKRIQTDQQTFTKQEDHIFETFIDAPFRVDGDATVSIPVAIDGDAAAVGTMFISGSLMVSGSNLTTLGTFKGREFSNVASDAGKEGFSTVRMTIPETKIKRGQYLQLEVQTWVKSSAGVTNVNSYMGWDPLGGGTHGTLNEWDFGSVNSAVDSAGRILIPIIIDL